MIRARSYDETVQRLTDDPIIRQMASEVPKAALPTLFHEAGHPTFGFMQAANQQYRALGGTDGGHIGAVAEAIYALVNT